MKSKTEMILGLCLQTAITQTQN